MSEINIYRCTPRQTRAFIVRCIQAGLVPFVKSSPGMGKSSLMRSVAKEFYLWLIDHRLSTSAPEDLSGLPEFYTDESGIRRARFVPFEMFPVVGTKIPDGYEGWMLFLDEANSGTKMVQAASYKLTLDKMVGQMHLHPNVAITMAGNHSTDRAIVTSLSTAMQSRVVHIDMIIDFEEWMADVALVEDYDVRIIAYLSWKEGSNVSALMDFQPDHQENTFCCPRTWEFMNRHLKIKPVVEDSDIPLFAGTITSGFAAEFVQFCHIYKEITTIDDVLRNPMTADIPAQSNKKWAISSNLVSKATDKNLDKLAQYMSRWDLAFRVMFFRTILAQKPALRTHPSFGPAMVEINKYLNEKLPNAAPPALPTP